MINWIDDRNNKQNKQQQHKIRVLVQIFLKWLNDNDTHRTRPNLSLIWTNITVGLLKENWFILLQKKCLFCFLLPRNIKAKIFRSWCKRKQKLVRGLKTKTLFLSYSCYSQQRCIFIHAILLLYRETAVTMIRNTGWQFQACFSSDANKQKLENRLFCSTCYFYGGIMVLFTPLHIFTF